MAKRCTECGGSDLTRTPVPNYRYVEFGLANVVIASGIELETCGQCGEESIRIPAVAKLHRAIALSFTSKVGKLSGPEIRFLRKSIGLAGKDFAYRLGVDPATVSRWENGKDPIGSTADRMLRLLVRIHDPAAELDYSYADGADANAEGGDIVLSRGRGGWHQAELAKAG